MSICLLLYFLVNRRIYPDLREYEKIGSKYFYFEHVDEGSWYLAEEMCQQKGGHLATIENEEELNAINEKLRDENTYWIGINDLEKEGDFVTLPSGRKAPYLKWHRYEPSYQIASFPGIKTMHCVQLLNGKMQMHNCYTFRNFICQADDI